MEIINKVKLKSIKGRQILDSRGTPTVEATVELDNGIYCSASVPSGASTGKYEACELRDNDPKQFCGKSVFKAVDNINNTINSQMKDFSIARQKDFDYALINLDATPNKSNLGANATLAVSLAYAKASAAASRLQLYQYIGGASAVTLPVPMMNILNGGAHADNNVDIQEFMIMPVGAKNEFEAVKMGSEIYHSLGSLLKKNGLSTAVGDEGGFAPNLSDDEEALQYLVNAIEKAGYIPGQDVKIALDIAASEWASGSEYIIPKKGQRMTAQGLMEYFGGLIKKYPIISIEDPLGEEDFSSFAEFTKQVGSNVQIVGDDLFVTNTQRLQQGIDNSCANAILIKPNQIGTLSETMEAVALAKANGYNTIISHRSGETEDTSIADIAVGLNAGQIKTGAPARTDRVCKYNRLMCIEHQLCNAASFGCVKLHK